MNDVAWGCSVVTQVCSYMDQRVILAITLLIAAVIVCALGWLIDYLIAEAKKPRPPRRKDDDDDGYPPIRPF